MGYLVPFYCCASCPLGISQPLRLLTPRAQSFEESEDQGKQRGSEKKMKSMRLSSSCFLCQEVVLAFPMAKLQPFFMMQTRHAVCWHTEEEKIGPHREEEKIGLHREEELAANRNRIPDTNWTGRLIPAAERCGSAMSTLCSVRTSHQAPCPSQFLIDCKLSRSSVWHCRQSVHSLDE